MPERAQDQTNSLSDVAKRLKALERVTRVRKRKPKGSDKPVATSGFQFLSQYETVFEESGTTGSGYGAIQNIDFSQFVPASATLAHCMVHMECQSTSALDGYLGLDWFPDGSPDWITLLYDRDQHVSTDDAEIDLTVNMTLPLSDTKTGQIRFVEAQVATWSYWIKIYGYS